MSGNYTVDVDIVRSVVRIRMSGFFEADDIAGFVAARRAAHDRLTCAPNQHCTITDTREMKIQSQEIVATFRQILADPAYRSRKLAFIAAPTLARTQLLRAIGGRGARVFDNPADAESWVLEEDRAAA